MEIQFSAEIIKALPIYLSTTWNNLIKEANFKYTKQYIYNAITQKAIISQQLNNELNILWNNLSLDYSDLENIYHLASTVELGHIKFKQYLGGK